MLQDQDVEKGKRSRKIGRMEMIPESEEEIDNEKDKNEISVSYSKKTSIVNDNFEEIPLNSDNSIEISKYW